MPRWRYWLYALAVIVGIERVLENAHYVSDVVGAAALGILAAHVTWHVLRRVTRARPNVESPERPVTGAREVSVES
jgi:membrane-associated phospholipid phosphatase